MQLGDILSAFLKSSGTSYRQLAAETGLSVSYINDIVKGKTRLGRKIDPPLSVLQKLAAVMGISVSDLVKQLDQ